MDNIYAITCGACGERNTPCVPEDAEETRLVSCAHCQAPLTTIGKLHALGAQQAIGLGVDDLSDDHVPIGGPPFGETT